MHYNSLKKEFTQAEVTEISNLNPFKHLLKEAKCSAVTILGYKESFLVYYNDEEIARLFSGFDIFEVLAGDYDIYWQECISNKMVLNNVYFLFTNYTVFVVENVTQNTEKIAEVKLQSCNFKLRQFKKLFANINHGVQYIFLLSDYMHDAEYRDTLNYLIDVGCKFYFNALPTNSFIGQLIKNKEAY